MIPIKSARREESALWLGDQVLLHGKDHLGAFAYGWPMVRDCLMLSLMSENPVCHRVLEDHGVVDNGEEYEG
jgi:hypothetical protein